MNYFQNVNSSKLYIWHPQNSFWIGFIFLLISMRCCDASEEIYTDMPAIAMDLTEAERDTENVNCDKEAVPSEKCWATIRQRLPTCMNRRKSMGLGQDRDEFVIVEASLGQDIQLECHYCQAMDEDVPKIWYYNDRLFMASEREIPQHLELPEEERKFIIDDHHMLTIRDFSENEGAVYFCQGLDDKSSKFNFLVDVVASTGGPDPLVGDEKDFQQYFKEVVKPLNKALAKEHAIEIKNWLNLNGDENFDIKYDWTPWGGCNACGRDTGIKRRHGKCRLTIPTPPQRAQALRKKGPLNKMKFGIEFSCQSLLLDRFLSPTLATRSRKLADFVENSDCVGTCLLDFRMNEDWNEAAGEKSLDFRQVVLWKVTEQRLSLICPRSDLQSEVVWIKDRKYLSPKTLQKSHGRLSLNVKNELSFRELTLEDNGNYTCYVKNVPTYAYELNVIEKPINNRDVAWLPTALGLYSLICFIIWIFLTVIARRVAKRIQHAYKPLRVDEQKRTRNFLKV